MTSPNVTPATPFGRVLTAMVTPFDVDGELDTDGAAQLAVELIESGHDGLDSIAKAQLHQQAGHMRLDGCLADDEFGF